MNNQGSDVPFSRIWLTAILVAIVLGVPSAFFAEKYPWVIAIPIAVGTLAVIVPEILGLLPPTGEQLPLIRMPRDYLGLSRYKGYAAIGLPTEEEEPDQQIFEFVNTPRRKPNKFPAIVKDEHGNDIVVIDAERFISLVVGQTADTTDRVAEATLKMAVHRYGETHGISDELERFLRDRTVLDVIKSDFRGNVSANLNNACESVIRALIKRRKAAKAESPVSRPTGT
jgi:hypothetical protein